MIGKEYPAERKRVMDEQTGRPVWQLTAGDSNNYHFYFTDNSFTLGDQEIYFLSDRASNKPEVYNLFKMDLATGKMWQLTDEKNGIKPSGHTKTPDSEIVVYVTGNVIKKLHTQTMTTSVIYEETNGVHLGHPFIAPNKKYIGVARNENPGLYHGENYNGFKEQMFAIKKGWITIIYLDGSQAVTIHESPHWLGHFQFSPADSTLAMFCHEGPWHLVNQRIWLLDLVSRRVVPCFRQEEDDCVGHEFWTGDGKIFFDNRRRGHDGTITSHKSQAILQEIQSGQPPYIGLADCNGQVLNTTPMPYYCNHYHANQDNTVLVGDQAEDLVLIQLQDGIAKIKTLCAHNTSWRTQQSHCHPTFSWDNEKILFVSDRDGTNHLYMLEAQDGNL
ncbi:oligogalacturonate lyase [Lucifera butyrica]|uniref:Oligogalacturonate lyase n=1 Tax=Lucifera butyrica TaxID=1351585 RepID=A0A498RAJ0_9FIRM|nr:oligogalacturonate lyase family protein [Lucifera butyrica]VBB08431.1 oligogalacturonate lyase [Lucifera butyrica]